ncbi:MULTISPECIES: GNAT family N-acetyltransferase [Lysinibacillus]|uniref:N-acetyltransferase n=1 Tax=Lysinibacillus fusiformis TaxID=28031 RepID=A0A2I0UZU7_9BACI|nr:MULTISPECIES: GNAT family N-acetyltransferase [Lysinibacillus]KUF36173.1 acetyltransferase [Lysinibacillus sp. F5]MEE3806444.1 GNAT family N-acetyltransferase [Lysinibacillus fusiformis]PKU51549.1 N-acetyltransferase [Lysinibacillus fusiformis]WCH45759.1 GNAT family N-acetyltransferase [Lysinibacillus sp. OF-1]SCY38941.1 Protein N-acetyltransferase, RimJ/RimL family [Lysinibacillus sp. SG9]
MILANEKLFLREFTPHDWIDVHKYASQEIVCRYQTWGPNTEEDSKEFIQDALDEARQTPRERYVFAIIYQETLIGSVEIMIRDFTNKVGEIGYIVNPDYWGKGVATQSAKLVITFGFDTLKLHRIYATCDPRNIGSSKVLEKVGMAKEGILRENMLMKDGIWRDSFLYSVLKQEWSS